LPDERIYRMRLTVPHSEVELIGLDIQISSFRRDGTIAVHRGHGPQRNMFKITEL